MAAFPLVSVFTPAYNHGRYLRETIQSVLAQGYPNLDYHIIDDGSTDCTPDVLKEFTGLVRWERQSNAGEIRTINRGHREARGELLIIINDDDTLLPGMIQSAVDFMQSNPDVLMCYPDFRLIDEDSVPYGPVQARPFEYEFMVRSWGCLPGPGVCLRRETLQLVPERSTRYEYVGDFEYWLRLGMHGPLARLPGVYSTHRTHATSKQVSHADRMAIEIMALAHDFFSRPDLPRQVRRFKREAMGAAWFEAAMRYPVRSWRCNLGLVRSILADPVTSTRRIYTRCPPETPTRSAACFLRAVHRAGGTLSRSLRRVS